MIARRFLLAAALAFAVTACAQAETLVNSGLRVEPLEVATATGVAKFQVEIADTDEAQEIGLMNRRSLAPDRGMLFQFGYPRQMSFWMKDTLIPLDIIFIRTDGRIDSIAENTKPLSQDNVLSRGAAIGVLEIAGGRARQLGIKPGDVVRHPFFRTAGDR